MPSLISNLYAFDDFRLDVQHRILRIGQKPVPLTPKAFEVLLLLIQHSGEVVSKDELMRAVWPDSFVEESNLTQTVFMLRKALGETPEQRYILTIQGRGYRFSADVKEVSGSVALAPENSISPPPTDVSQPEPAKQSRGRKMWLVTGAVLLLLAAALTGYFRWSKSRLQTRKATGRVMLAVLPFENLTGDPTQEYFSDGLTRNDFPPGRCRSEGPRRNRPHISHALTRTINRSWVRLDGSWECSMCSRAVCDVTRRKCECLPSLFK